VLELDPLEELELDRVGDGRLTDLDRRAGRRHLVRRLDHLGDDLRLGHGEHTLGLLEAEPGPLGVAGTGTEELREVDGEPDGGAVLPGEEVVALVGGHTRDEPGPPHGPPHVEAGEGDLGAGVLQLRRVLPGQVQERVEGEIRGIDERRIGRRRRDAAGHGEESRDARHGDRAATHEGSLATSASRASGAPRPRRRR
jgi:hypothetical protein